VSAGQFASQAEADALLGLLGWLKERDYRFVTITPASHQRVISRPGWERAESLAGAFGWSLPFARELLPENHFAALDAAGLLSMLPGGLYRSKVRVSSLGGDLFVHSAFPTEDEDAVFFGPDSYRFAAMIERELEARHRPIASIVDIGTGGGVGAIVAGRRCPGARLAGTDINSKALAFAEVTAQAAGLTLELAQSAMLDAFDSEWDLVLANPPFMIDAEARAYRDGGNQLGADASLAMTRAALARLAPGGLFLLYTGSAIVRGRDQLREDLAEIARTAGAGLDYREIDPDVFGEELSTEPYREVDRIAIVAAVFERAT
jgi:methylase of polypeptide subunit release factors